MARRAPLTAFSIGYQGKRLDAFCDLLVEAGVRKLVDVRARAWSNRPEFRKTALANALRARGVEYVHCKVAGNPFRPTLDAPQTWSQCRRKYKRHVRANPAILDEVEAQLRQGRVALFCYECDRAACHRGVLLDELRLKITDLQVADLL